MLLDVENCKPDLQPGLTTVYSSGGLELTVPGIVTAVSSQILRTDSVIVDAILGQGEALIRRFDFIPGRIEYGQLCPVDGLSWRI